RITEEEGLLKKFHAERINAEREAAKLEAELRAQRTNLQNKESALKTAETQRTADGRDLGNAIALEKKSRDEIAQFEKNAPLLAENSAAATTLHEAALREQTESGT